MTIDQVIAEIAKALGVQPGAIQGALISLMFIVLLYVLRLLLMSRQQDTQQTAMAIMLTQLASNAVGESKNLREAYENNTTALTHIKDAFRTMGDGFVNEMKAIVSELRDVKDELVAQTLKVATVADVVEAVERGLIKSSPTTIIVRDQSGADILKLIAKPEQTGNETALVVSINVDTAPEKLFK